MPRYSLRAARDTDFEFSFLVTQDAMKEYVEATWGEWNAGAQREAHAKSFDVETYQVVCVAGQEAGILAVEDHPAHVQLEILYLLAGFRNSGVGAALLQDVLARARGAGKPVRLRVLRVNTSAQRFYARHGFVTTSATRERCFMAWDGDDKR